MSDFHALFLTLWGETRGEPIEGQIAVACVIRNRVLADIGKDGKPDWWGEGYRGVCLAPRQFSCWAPEDGAENYATVMRLAHAVCGDYADRTTVDLNDPVMRQLKAIAENVMNGTLLDRSGGATQYLTKHLFSTAPPPWALNRPVRTIGSQVFLTA